MTLRTTTYRLCLALLATVVAGSAAAQASKKPGEAVVELALDGTISDDHKHVLFPKPADWKCIDRKSEPIPVKNRALKTVLSFRARTIPWGNIDIEIYLITGVELNNRLQAISERRGHLKLGYAAEGKYELAMKPVPHAVYPIAKKPDRTILMVHRRAKGRVLAVSFEIDTKHAKKARQALLQLACKVETKLAPWPPRAAGYEFEPESGIELAFKPGTSKKARKYLHGFVKKTVRQFIKDHARPEILENEPVIVYVDDDIDQHKVLLMTEDHEFSSVGGVNMRRLVTTTLSDGDADPRREFAYALKYLLMNTLYPANEPGWLDYGEAGVDRMAAVCGKRLPFTPKKWHNPVTRLTMKLDEMTAKLADVPFYDATGWVSFFRIGPSKYRSAYKALLKELRTGHEPAVAIKTFLDGFDHAKLRAQARKTLRSKLKPVK